MLDLQLEVSQTFLTCFVQVLYEHALYFYSENENEIL